MAVTAVVAAARVEVAAVVVVTMAVVLVSPLTLYRPSASSSLVRSGGGSNGSGNVGNCADRGNVGIG